MNETLERSMEAGLVTLIAVAIQMREGHKGEPTDAELDAARALFTRVFDRLLE